MNSITLILLMLLPELIIVLFLLWYLRLPLILKGQQAKLQVTPLMLIGMRMRQVNPDLIVLNAIKLRQAGIDLQIGQSEELLLILEAHCLAGGNVSRVTAALLEAKKRAEPLSLHQACSIDLELTGREKSNQA